MINDSIKFSFGSICAIFILSLLFIYVSKPSYVIDQDSDGNIQINTLKAISLSLTVSISIGIIVFFYKYADISEKIDEEINTPVKQLPIISNAY